MEPLLRRSDVMAERSRQWPIPQIRATAIVSKHVRLLESYA